MACQVGRGGFSIWRRARRGHLHRCCQLGSALIGDWLVEPAEDSHLLLRRDGHARDQQPADFIFPGAYFKRGTAAVHAVVETTPGRTAELRTPWSADELRTGYCVHFAFEVPSLDTYRDIFAGSGIAPVGGPRIRADNVEQIYLADPDGHIIELLSRSDT